MARHDTSVRSGGASLHVSQWGTSGRVLLCLHPGVGDSRVWSWCAPRWAAEQHRVVASDRRGFGFTHAGPEHHDDVVDLLEVMNATDSTSAIVVGNSRGGGLAIDLAVRHPERVLALVLVAPSVSGYDDQSPPTPAEAEQAALIDAADEAHDLELLNRLETRFWLDGVEQPEGRVSGEARELFVDMNGRALRAPPIGDHAERTDVWPTLAQVEIPVLVVVGELDLPRIRARCRALVAELPNAELVEIPDSAHCPQLDQVELLTSIVLDFSSDLNLDEQD